MPFDPNKFQALSAKPAGFDPEKFRALSLPDTATTTPVTPPAVTVPAPVRYDATRNPYGSLIQKHATTYGVDPHLVEAMIQHESSGNPKAVSPKGATGLMQLMPDTAREEGVRNPFDPDENIRGGAQRLAKLLKDFGTPEKALWAYNAGPDSARTRPMPDETRKYIQNVLKTYRDLDFQNQAKQPLPSIGQRQLPGRSVVAMPADLVDLFPNASPSLSRGGGIVQRAAGGLVEGAAEAAATWHTPTMQPLGQRAVAPVRTIGEEMRAAGEAAIAANPPQEKYRLPESFKGYFTPEFGAKLFDPSFWATNIPEQAVIMAPFMVAAAAGVIPGYVLGNVLFEAGNQFADAKAHGASDQEALLSSCVVAAANVPISAVGIIPGTEAIKRWSAPAVARKAAAVALDWFGEGVEEGGQRWAQNLSAHLTYDPKQKLTEGVGAEAMAGLTVAGPTKAAGLALSPLRSTEGPAQPPGAPPAATPQTTPPGSPAQPEPAASQAPAVPGVQPAVQPGTLHAEVRAYQDEMRTVSPEMALVEVRPVPALTADDRDVQRIGRKLGRDVRLVQARQDGQAMQLQMPAWTAPGSGRIYVEAGNPGMALLGLFHHELQHSMEQTDAELYNAWLDRLVAEAPTLIEEARAQYAALAPALLRERLTREALTKEGAAQLAQVMTPEMVEKWQSEDPKMWERFVTKVREVLAKMGWYDEGRRAEILRNSEKAKAIRAFEDLIGAAQQTAIRTKPGQVAPAPSGGRMVVTQQPAEEAEEVPDWVTEDQSEKPDVEQGLVSEDEWNRAAPPKKQRHKKHKRVKDYIGNVNLRSVQRTNKANGEVLGYYGEFTDHLSSRDPAKIEKTVRRFIRTGRINGENQGRDADSIAGFINNASEGFPQSLQNILAGGADRAVTGFDVLRALGDESLRNQPVLDEEEAVRQGEVIRYAEAFVQEKEQKIADAQEAIAETEAELEKPNLPEDQRAAMVQYVADLEEVIAGAQKERDEANEQAIDARAGKFAQRMIVDKELGATPVIPGTLPKPKVPMTAKPRGTAGLEGTLLGGKSKEELAQEADKKAGRQIPMFAQRAALRPEDRSLAEEYWKLQAKVHTAPVGERETLRKTLLEMGRQLRERGVTPQQMNRAGLDMERKGRFALKGGEFWLQNGNALSADSAVDDLSHEGVVLDNLLNEAADILQVLVTDSSFLDKMENPDARTVAKLKRGGMSDDAVSAMIDGINGEGDIREYGMRRLGWVRVQGDNVQTWDLDKAKLNEIANGLWDAYAEEDEANMEGETFNIEVMSTGKYYTDVPWDVIAEQKMGELRQYDRDVTGRFALKPAPDTPAFRAWFGQSKVVDEKGEPKMMYHGTPVVPYYLRYKGPELTADEVLRIAEQDLGVVVEGQLARIAEAVKAGQPFKRAVEEYGSHAAAGELGGEFEQGEAGDIEVFRSSRGVAGHVAFTPDVAGSYAGLQEGSRIFPVWVKAENPFDIRRAEHVGKLTPYIRERLQGGARKDYTTLEDRSVQVAMQNAGFDSYYDYESEADTEAQGIAVFKPTQIKSATGNRGTYDRTNPDIRFALRDPPQREPLAPTLYSALRVAADRLPEKAPAATILNALKKQPNVKSDEIDATGLADFLGDRKGITRQEVQDYLDENAVEVRVVEKGAPSNKPDSPRYAYLELREQHGNLTTEEGQELDDLRAVYGYPWDEEDEAGAQYERPELNLPGAVPGSYREILLTLPSAESPRARQLRDELENLVALPASETTYKGEDRQKAYDRLHAEFVRAGGTPRRREFRSGHWTEPNVVAHIRMDERTGLAGERVLFLEEIQSDWHEIGRKEGYAPKNTPEVRVTNEMIGEVINTMRPILERVGMLGFDRMSQARNAIREHEDYLDRWDLRGKLTAEEVALFDKFREYAQMRREDRNARLDYKYGKGVPDAPWKDTARWTELALKHAVRYAAENGYDAVAWTTGDQQNDRYDLRKYVDSVLYAKTDDGTYTIKATLTPGGDPRTIARRVSPGKLPGVVGKEVARKIVAGEGEEVKFTSFRQLTGLDLEVGGSGMREYYDRIVPDVAKALARKLDKGHPGVRGIDLVTATEESPVAESGEAFATTPQQSIAITPAMAQTVLEQGQPMFAQRQRPDAKHAFEDADVWADHIANRGIERPTLGQKVGQAFVVAKNRITRDYEHLPKGARFSSARFQLHLLEKSKGMASELAMEKVDAITKSLDEDEYDLLGNILYLRDLRMRLRKDIPVPTPWDKDSVERELERQEKFLEDNPRVKEAIDARVQMVAAVNKEYVDSAEDIGFHVRDIIGDDPDYWHHQVMEHYGVKNIGLYGTGKRVKTPRGRGFLKAAEGTLLPHNTDYVQAEYEVVAQKIADTFQNRFIKRIDEDYNVYEEAKERARVANKQAAREIFLSIAMDTEPTAADLKKADDTNADLVEVIANRLEGRLGVRQAMGFEKLRNAVELPTPQDGSFDEVAEALRADTLSDDQMPDLFHYLAWIMKNHPDTEAGAGAAMIFKGMGMKRKAIQDMLKKAGRYSTFRDEMPEGYEEWQPDPGTVFYNAFTLPTQMVLRATEQGLKELNIPTDVIRRVLAVGGRRKSMVIPSELAETLNNMTTRSQRGALDNVAFRAMGKPWKIWSLVGPPRVIKYNLRNPSGDADHILAGNPGAFARSAQATGELWQFMISKSRTATPEIRDYYMMGGFSSTLGVQELGDLHDLEAFRKLYGRYGGWSKVPKKVWNAYWKTARVGTEYREQILRYSAYLWYLDNLNTHEGKPTNWGASIPEEVMALRDNKEKAFKLSNDLLGPYDEVSVYGKQLRDGLIPFWSWNEVDFRIYKRIVRNVSAEGRLLESMPTIAGIAVKNAGKLAVRNAVRTAIGANLMWAALTAWNRLVVPDEDDEVPTEERSRVHITFPGRGPKGEVRYFSRLGALGDLLDWFTLQSAPRHARDFLNGYKTLPRILTDMLLIAPSEKLVNALNPVGMKGVTEMLTGRKLYPSWTKPVTVRDRWEYLFDMWDLKPEYRLATGKPGKPYAQRLEELVWYNAVPGEADYHELQEDVAEWNRKRLGVRSGFILTEPGRALYNLRMAWRYDNAEAIERYKREYLAFNRTTQDVQRGFEELAPLSSLPREDRLLFIESLDEAGRKRLAKALQFYTSHMLGSKGDVFFNPFPIIADRAQQIMQKENLSEQDAVRRMLTEAPGSVKPSELLDELRARKKALAERAKSQEVRQAEADKSELESDFDANQASAALLFAQYHHLIRQGRKAEAMRVMSALKDLTSQYGATSDRMFGELLRGPQDVEKFQGRYKKFFWELKTGQRELPRRKRPELPVPLPGKRPTKQPAEQSFHW